MITCLFMYVGREIEIEIERDGDSYSCICVCMRACITTQPHFGDSCKRSVNREVM